MTLPSHIIMLNLQRDELEGRLRALSEEYFIWARNEALTRWEASGAHTAQFVLHGRHEEGYDEAVQKVTEALKRDVYELTKILAKEEMLKRQRAEVLDTIKRALWGNNDDES